MDQLKTFMEASSIHGIQYISTTRKYSRLFWLLVLFTGFSGAVFIIYQSFQAWNESPVKTIIETRPISEMTYPKVIVCPPKNTYTNLNYDLMMAAKMIIENETRIELNNYAMNLLYDHLHASIMTNLSKLVEQNRYYNWYHGHSDIVVPQYNDFGYFFQGVRFSIGSSAKSGSIFTQYFGEKFEADKIETGTKFLYAIGIHTPKMMRNNTNVTLHFKIERVALKDLSGDEFLDVEEIGKLNEDITQIGKNYTPPKEYSYSVTFERKVTKEDAQKQKLDLMPGFRLTWHFSGLEEVPAQYTDSRLTQTFVR